MENITIFSIIQAIPPWGIEFSESFAWKLQKLGAPGIMLFGVMVILIHASIKHRKSKKLEKKANKKGKKND